MVYMLERMGVSTGINLPMLVEIARWLESVCNRPLPGRVKQSSTYTGDSPDLQLA
jgi:hydroxymethylglutaryl-CoA lyase